jgi:uncharacterized protein
MRRLRPLFALAVIAMCGCSANTNFYTLSRLPAASGAGILAAEKPLIVAIGPVSLPDYADCPQIVVRDSPYTIRPAPFDQWAGDLDDMLPRVLTEDVADRLPAYRVVQFPQIAASNVDYRVVVDITRFDVSSDGDAAVAAGWQIYERGNNKPLLLSDSTARAHAASSSYPDRVAALSQALADLAGEIARALAPPPPSQAGNP